MNTLDRFLQYVKIDTQSDEDSNTHPSTTKQHQLALLLSEELQAMGAQNVFYDRENCYVYATIPPSEGYETKKILGFIAHMDTSPAVSGENVLPKIVKNYDGGDILLNEKQDIWMKVSDFPELLKLQGDDLVVTDGTTLLGADDKAGVSEIMSMAEALLNHPEWKHGPIRIAFTPDEEIGCGTDFFDLKRFGADFAYTVDGGALGELEYENFNAASGKLMIKGRNVHPGSAKGKMINSILVAQEFQSLLPVFENPMYTEGYEGFFHLDRISGTVEQTVLEYIIRDHDKALFEQKKETFQKCAAFLNQKYGDKTATAQVTDSYYNMKEPMKNHMHLVENACLGMKELGITPKISPIRGGTDGARLTYLGLPCPNLCTGGANYHSRFEYASVQSMEKTTDLLIWLCQKYGE